MPRSVSEEELALKKRARRRLIGAIALVTLVIVLLPMFLDSEPRPLNQEVSIQIPAQSTEFSSRVAALPKSAPVGEGTPGTDAKAPEAANPVAAEPEKRVPEVDRPAVEEEKPRAAEPERGVETEKRTRDERASRAESKSAPKASEKKTSKTEPKSETKPAPKPAPKPVAEAPKEKESGGESFVVQVAALTDAEKAKLLKSRIADSGLRAYTEVIKTARGDVTRVRVGPYASKEAAQKAAEELKKLGLSGVVAPKG
jgi:DedD protein